MWIWASSGDGFIAGTRVLGLSVTVLFIDRMYFGTVISVESAVNHNIHLIGRQMHGIFRAGSEKMYSMQHPGIIFSARN